MADKKAVSFALCEKKKEESQLERQLKAKIECDRVAAGRSKRQKNMRKYGMTHMIKYAYLFYNVIEIAKFCY